MLEGDFRDDRDNNQFRFRCCWWSSSIESMESSSSLNAFNAPCTKLKEGLFNQKQRKSTKTTETKRINAMPRQIMNCVVFLRSSIIDRAHDCLITGNIGDCVYVRAREPLHRMCSFREQNGMGRIPVTSRIRLSKIFNAQTETSMIKILKNFDMSAFYDGRSHRHTKSNARRSTAAGHLVNHPTR